MKTNKILLAITASLLLTSCYEKIEKPYNEQAINHVKYLKPEIHHKYLNCYPLHQEDKKQCVKALNNEYIKKNKSNKEYVQSFAFEAEKLGFKNFLEAKKLECKKIKYGPEYDDEQKAYLVKCGDETNYLMQFNYKTKTWSLKDE